MAASDALVSPRRFKGPEISDLLQHYWDQMSRTRRNAERTATVIAGEEQFVLPATFQIAGADQYIAEIPHPRTVPSRILQQTIARRPHLSIPLGPKGLGITAQRLTTRVEQPLNAICEDRKAGFQWSRACALLAFEGFCASVTVLDPSDWRRHPSAWDDEKTRTWKKRYRVDEHGRDEDHENYSGTVDDSRARRMHDLDQDVFRARNVPIRHRAVGIRQCAPIFDGDMDAVGGLIISQEFSTSYLRRHYRFGDAGVATPTGGTAHEGGGARPTNTVTGGTLTLIEAWLYDEDGLPYVTYCIKGPKGPVDVHWKGGDYDGQTATIGLKERFGIERLPVTWRFGLGNPAETNADLRAMGVIEPFAGGWRSVRAKMTANNVAIMFGSYPILIEESDGPGGMAGSLEDDEPTKPDVEPLKITSARPGTHLKVLELQAISPEAFKQIELELGAVADETPGKSNKDQSGFSQSMAQAFEELAMTVVHDNLGELYEDHGSFVLEAGKRLPEQRKGANGSGYAPIMVFKSTDVPPSDTPGSGDAHNEPMVLDPDLIDETFTAKARYTKSMSIPEEQQSMESVARNLKTRRAHLEDTGDENPEQTELELIAEAQRATSEYQKYLMALVAKIQGAEELEEITKAQSEGLANEDGLPTGFAQGVAPAVPGELAPMLESAPGVPTDGSLTGMAPPSYGPAALAGVIGGAAMTGPINNATAAGGVIPPSLPGPGVP